MTLLAAVLLRMLLNFWFLPRAPSSLSMKNSRTCGGTCAWNSASERKELSRMQMSESFGRSKVHPRCWLNSPCRPGRRQ
eukprot:754037-Hanusia_phi.AAC.4